MGDSDATADADDSASDSRAADAQSDGDAAVAMTGSIKVPASSLLAPGATDGRAAAFGKGSTYADLTGFKIAYAYAKIAAGSASAVGTETANAIGVDAAGALVDGQIDNLAAGTYSLDVTGYLRGLTADLAATPDTRIPFMRTTCSASVVAGTVATATCTPLSYKDASGTTYIKGIIFPSDFLGPSGGAVYASTTSGMDLDVWRARTPTSGTAAASVAESDPRGVIFIDEAKFASTEATARETSWSISVELKSASVPACTTAPGCKVVRKDASGSPLALVFVDPSTHAGCIANSTTTSTTACFQ
jgi:hypothetical protein